MLHGVCYVSKCYLLYVCHLLPLLKLVIFLTISVKDYKEVIKKEYTFQ